MFDNPQLYLYTLVAGALLYWSIPQKSLRLNFLLCVSFVLIFMFYPLALPFALAMTIVGWFSARLLAAGTLSSVTPTVITLVAVFSGTRLYAAEHSVVVDAGLTFVLLKTLGAVIEAQRKRRPFTLRDFLLLNFLYPIYPTGPVELIKNVSPDCFSDAITISDIGEGVYRIVLGLAKVVFVVDVVLAGMLLSLFPAGLEFSQATTSSTWLAAYVKFLILYLNFSGAIDIVVGTGRIFGIRLSENFNFPVVATNLQEFWKRWHMSLGRWINLYLFAVMVRRTGMVVLSIMTTFLLVGLWHSYTVNYAIWGMCHGIGLSIVYVLGKKQPAWHTWIKGRLYYRVFCWWLTISTVSVLSVFANMKDLESGITFLRALTGTY